MARKARPVAHDLLARIGQRLAQLRQEHGITQKELAKLLGISQPNVSGYERGLLRLHGDLIVKLTEILKVSSDELLGIKTSPRTPRLRSRRLIQRVEQIERLPRRDREALTRIINSFLAATPIGERAAKGLASAVSTR